MDRTAELARTLSPKWAVRSLTLINEPLASAQYVAILDRTGDEVAHIALVVRSQKFMRSAEAAAELAAWKDLLVKISREMEKGARTERH